MVPRVFVSSTVRDLAHLRQGLRETVLELGYQPVMSEYGEIGYSPSATAAESCFREAENCDLGILIVAKRYGDDYSNGRSVTHGEFHTLHSRKIPIVTLIERDVMAFKAVVEANSNTKLDFPGMDRPERTFQLVDEVRGCSYNNGVHEFQQLSEAREAVRTQLAHVFGELLRARYDPMRAEIKDVLASIAALRDTIKSKEDDAVSQRFLRASRELLEDDCAHFKKFVSGLLGGFNVAVHSVLKHPTFDALVDAARKTVQIEAADGFFARPRQGDELPLFGEAWSGPPRDGQVHQMHYMVYADKICVSEGALELLRACHTQVRAAAGTP